MMCPKSVVFILQMNPIHFTYLTITISVAAIVMGPHLPVFDAYSSLWSPRFLLLVLGGPYAVPCIEQGIGHMQDKCLTHYLISSTHLISNSAIFRVLVVRS